MTDKQCGKKAKARFTWGGIGEESYCCAEHGQQLQSLCDHMGWQQTDEIFDDPVQSGYRLRSGTGLRSANQCDMDRLVAYVVAR